ncbi:MAG: ATP-dependent Clp protease ATP-binding subunit [Anaerolineales bacterium]|uniref:AAA family ATPase n=1 Tax=Candidatus Villigracilis vicinus TaxID=3140679 RepID=UPI0031350B76|nr:ATP-dependent Clp protease ATP-binding subunit [Anaerolineales bacterium]
MSDTKYRGELEQRLREILKTLEEAPRTTILFIDEIHILEQAKGTEGAVNISDILKPALSRGDLQIIGATTWDEYEEYIHPDAALDRRLQPVLVDEPTAKQALHMLQSL